MLYFVHLPKTAGTSFVSALEKAWGGDAVMRLYGKAITSEMAEKQIGELSAERRDRLRAVAGHQVWFGIHRLFDDPDPRYVTFVRHPVSRVFSDYYKILRTPGNEFHRQVTGAGVTLRQFVEGTVSPFVTNHMTVFLSRTRVDDNHNGASCVPHDPEALSRACDNLAACWHVGTRETFADDIASLAGKLGIELPVMHENRPPTASAFEASFDLETIAACLERNRMDVVVHEYAALLRERGRPGGND